MSGKDWKVYISSDGTSSGTMTAIEDQGDLSVNPGKTLSRTPYKDGSRTAQGADGWSASYQGALRAPLGTGQALLVAAFNAGGDAYIQVKSTITGGIEWAGDVKVNITGFEFPVDGEESVTVEFSEDGTVTQGTTS